MLGTRDLKSFLVSAFVTVEVSEKLAGALLNTIFVIYI